MAGNTPQSQSEQGSYVTTGRFLGVVLLAGLIIPAVITFIVKAEPLALGPAGRSLGATAFLVGAAAAVVLPWRAFQSRTGKFTDAPIVYGGFFFVVFSVVFIIGAIKSGG